MNALCNPVWLLVYAATCIACGGPREAAVQGTPIAKRQEPAQPAPAPVVRPDAGSKSDALDGGNDVVVSVVAFPPAEFAPPQAQSAQPGDGKWQPIGDASKAENAAQAPRLLYRTVVHPHRVSKFKAVTIVAMDLSRARLNIIAGVDDPKSDTVPAEDRSGVVPKEEHTRVLAAFNGSWQTRHGQYGMMKAGRVFVPPREDACTVAIYQDGSVRLRSWPVLAADVEKMHAWRQAPGCLLENGQLHPDFAKNDERRWGGRDPKRQTRRRSAIALDASGQVLFYGFGEETGPKELALGLQAAGAAHAAELDINYYWVRFLMFGSPKADAPLQVTSTLIPKMEHRRRGYLHLAEPRDFFYLIRKAP